MTKPTPDALARYASEFNESRTLKNFGLRLGFPDAATCEVVLDPIREEQRGGLGSDAVNGGVLAAIFDLVIGCTPALLDPARRTATVQLNLNFMKPVRGDRLVARAHVTQAGNTLVFSRAEVLDERGEVCATATGLSRLSKDGWARDGTPAVY